MNAQGIAVERRAARRIYASFHGALSFGAVAGAASAGAVAALGVSPAVHLAALGAIVAGATHCAGRQLLPAHHDAAPAGPMFVTPSRALAALGVVSFCCLLAEGAVFDWSAVYLRRTLDAGEATAAAGLAAFSLTMGLGRLAGDRLTLRLGPVALARAGSLVAAAGIATALVVAEPAPALAGFAAMGLGLATLFPLALRAAAARSDSPGPAVAAVSATGYSGFLAGPPMIGGLAEATSLRTALVTVALLCTAAALLSRAVAMRRTARAATACDRSAPVPDDGVSA
jgi:fucose permease